MVHRFFKKPMHRFFKKAFALRFLRFDSMGVWGFGLSAELGEVLSPNFPKKAGHEGEA